MLGASFVTGGMSMTSRRVLGLRAVSVLALSAWVFVAWPQPAWAGTLAIPTLDAGGLVALTGILGAGGAWWLNRRRDRD
jgi:hypothetical protein